MTTPSIPSQNCQPQDSVANPALLCAEHVSLSFSDSGGEVEALEDVCFDIQAGEFVCLLGPSGCGKSTLLRILAGLLTPTSGQVWLNGALLRAPSRQIGLVFQSANLMPWRTVLRNIALPLEVAGMPAHESLPLAHQMIDLVGLQGFENALPMHLSGGMQHRVAIARALIHDPQVLMLDEPFAALDALTRERMNMELQRIWGKQRKTVVMVTHNIQEAIFLSTRILVMSQRPGRLINEFSVPFGRPREAAILYEESFGELAHAIRTTIQMEP